MSSIIFRSKDNNYHENILSTNTYHIIYRAILPDIPPIWGLYLNCNETSVYLIKWSKGCTMLFDLSSIRLVRSKHTTLRWRPNERDGVSNHQPHDCLLNRLFRPRSKKTSKLRVAGLCVGISPGAGEFPAQMASKAKNVSIWWRHHGYLQCWLLLTKQWSRLTKWNFPCRLGKQTFVILEGMFRVYLPMAPFSIMD